MRILLGVPSSGNVSWTSATAAILGSRKHQVFAMPSCQSGPNYNSCLVAALNECEKGHFDLHAQIHADLAVIDKKVPCPECHGECCDACFHRGEVVNEGWLDICVDEMLAHDADFISVAMAIKDTRHATSCGIGNPANRWNPWRRFTTKELATILPKTFSAEDIGYGAFYSACKPIAGIKTWFHGTTKAAPAIYQADSCWQLQKSIDVSVILSV